MEQRRNARAGKMGDPRVNPPTSGIVRHDSHMQKSGSDPAWERPMRVTFENGAAPELEGRGNGRSPRKPADQRHSPARFLHAKIRSDPAGDWTLIALVGGEQYNHNTTAATTSNLNQDTVEPKFVISNTSEFYDMWIRAPVDPLLKIYIFNYTNLDAVRAGRDKKFNVDELGPYTYREFMEKVDVEFNNDNTVTYRENRSYVFLPEMSSGKEDDVIVSPKITTISATSMLPKMNVFMHLAMSLVLHSSSTFLEQTVRDFLWVGDNELLTIGAKIMEGEPFGDFGILSLRAGKSRYRLTVNTGVKDPTQLNVVSRLDDRTRLEAWGDNECDRIDGSAGIIFPANAISPELPLYLFSPDICRRFPLSYQRHVQVSPRSVKLSANVGYTSGAALKHVATHMCKGFRRNELIPRVKWCGIHHPDLMWAHRQKSGGVMSVDYLRIISSIVAEVSNEKRSNEEAGKTGDPRENPPTNGIVLHDFHMLR
ncbi:hypothetical protein PR048_013793 [Dryococelus australis]|uniref:Uncharacterized protein n=1 Tax=Dryococelus australis TaxID=614101 RepID=A0ABQ9HTB1_9NEOP|nr:hypothetical protein PR048_013793 [Dryococelus australis]